MSQSASSATTSALSATVEHTETTAELIRHLTIDTLLHVLRTATPPTATTTAAATAAVTPTTSIATSSTASQPALLPPPSALSLAQLYRLLQQLQIRKLHQSRASSTANTTNNTTSSSSSSSVSSSSSASPSSSSSTSSTSSSSSSSSDSLSPTLASLADDDWYVVLLVTTAVYKQYSSLPLLWARIPAALKNNSSAAIHSVWKILQALESRDYSNFFTLLAQAQETPEALWSRLVHVLKASVLAENEQLISQAYTSISADTMKQLLGFTTDQQLHERVTLLGWSTDASGLILPRPMASRATASADDMAKQMKLVSDYARIITHLEAEH